MGSPDLPNDENNISRPVASSLPMHGGNITASDDSDLENIENGYAGYQPLAFDEETMEYTNENNDELDETDADDDFDYQVSQIIDRNFVINCNFDLIEFTGI